jgi:hypothetical protein
MASNSQVGKAKQAEQDDCPLLSLPAEIRNMIWEYAFGVDHIQAIQYDRPVAGKASNQYDTPSSSYTMSFEVRDRNNWRSKPQHLARLIALTSTCRQIRADCNDLPFSGNLFDVGFHAIQHFLAMVPQKILDGIKVISLWKVPGQMMTSVGDMHFLQPGQENDRRVWLALLRLLRGLPALKKIILRVRGGVDGLRIGQPWDVRLKLFVEWAFQRIVMMNVEVEMV